ncbi:transposase [Clostridium gasigenes]|uniref:transposase n=1 Tax=Clostridium gasigenes TaxID=94869 RepID=UPI001C0CF9A0|nr:transposase [Clostridium gasigenes]MBU3134066.1 transposase [Clostridium gasigenes]
MPTKTRLWYESAAYHVTSRGNNKINIFNETQDFKKYLSVIYEAMEYYKHNNYELICYCLMTNHVHLMIKTGDKPLGNFMGRINSNYTKYFNKKYDCSGHLFQGRYFSDIVKDNTQILETSRYIHLNPVKAKIVNKPSEYKWSSYSMITGEIETELVNSDIILNHFNDENKYNSYKSYVELKTPLGCKI